MKAGEIYTKTMPFVWAKLMLGLATVLISAVLFGILMGLAWLFNSEGVTGIMILIWLAATGTIRFIIMHYIGYMVKAGHIAVIAEAATTGRVPNNQVAYGKQMVTERFATSNVYFALDKLVAGAVKQIQKGIGKLGNALDFIPGMGTLTGLAQFFIDLSLGYIDECCLGYTFYKKEQGPFKSAADGVAVYAQNWKTLLTDAAKTMVMVILSLIVITLILFVALGLLFRLFAWPGGVAFIIALMIAFAIKFSFIDSFILTRTMTAYMGVAPSTVITFDLYGNLCKLSSRFKELFDKGQNEQPAPQPAYAGAYGAAQAPSPAQNETQEENAVFCGHCGVKNQRDVKFCGGCGNKLG